MPYEFSERSLAYIAATPGVLSRTSSADLGWTSLLATHTRVSDCEPFERVPTTDQIVCLPTRGTGEVSFCDGTWRRAAIRAGAVSVIPGSTTFKVGWKARPGTPPPEFLHVFLPREAAAEAAEHFRRPGCRPPAPSAIALSVRDGAVARVGRSLLAAIRAGAPDIYAQATAQWLAVHLLAFRSGASASEDGRRAGSLGDPRLSRTLEFIDAHLEQPLDLETLAAEAGASKFHFARLFRSEVGETPIQYLYGRRLERAARLLRHDGMAIKQIAHACGFRTVSHLSESFRGRFGISPSSFRHGRR